MRSEIAVSPGRYLHSSVSGEFSFFGEKKGRGGEVNSKKVKNVILAKNLRGKFKLWAGNPPKSSLDKSPCFATAVIPNTLG